MLFFIVCACFALFPENVLHGAQNGLALCINAIVPSLLPFMFVSECLIASGFSGPLGAVASKLVTPITGISPNGCICLITGLLGGYGAGARAVYESYRKNMLTKEEAQLLLPVCNNAGPLFVTATVGVGFFSSKKIGMLLLCVQILTAIIIGIILFYKSPRKKSSVKKEWRAYAQNKARLSGIIAEGAASAGEAVVTVCVFVITFSAILQTVPIGEISHAAPFLEIMRGCAELSREGVRSLPLLSATIFWSGISVHMQTNALCKGELGMRSYTLWRAIGAVAAYWLTSCVYRDAASTAFCLIFALGFIIAVLLAKKFFTKEFFPQSLFRQQRHS